MWQYECLSDYTKSLKEEILEPLKVFLENQVTKGRKYHIEIKELEREFKNVQDQLEKTKQRFHIFAKNAEDAKLQSEISKNNLNLSNDHKNKFLNKALLNLKEAKDAEKIYIDNLNYANNYRDKYIEGVKKIIDEFQKMEEKYIDFTKEALKKYFNFNLALFKNKEKENEKRLNLTEAINTTEDIKMFIEKNSTNSLPPYKFEFVPYTSEVQSRHYEQASYPIGKIKLFLYIS